MVSTHCASLMSAPVGLWQQAWRTTIEPAGKVFSLAFMPSKFTPRVAAS